MKTKTIITLFAVASVTVFTGASVAQQYGNRLAVHDHDIRSRLVETSKLSNREQDALLYMAEEEKLARDLYAAFEEKWGRSSFRSITSSEQNHIDEINAVLEFYGLSAAAGDAGKYGNRDLQKLYDDLLAKGSVSLSEAIKAAALVEDLDISDLKEYLSGTENANLQLVFNNLLQGSENHLRAFARQLSGIGEEYTAQHISAADYEAIISGSNPGRGNRYAQADSLRMRRFADDSTYFYGRRDMQGNRSTMMPGMQGRTGMTGRQGMQGMQGMQGRKNMQDMQGYGRGNMPSGRQGITGGLYLHGDSSLMGQHRAIADSALHHNRELGDSLYQRNRTSRTDTSVYQGRGMMRRNNLFDNRNSMPRNRNMETAPAPVNRQLRNQNI